MSTAQQFKEWVAQQDPQQVINHFSYDSCAIGLFAETQPGVLTVDDVAGSIRHVWGHQAYMFIGNGGKSDGRYKTPWDHMKIDTMGNLHHWLTKLEPVAWTVATE